MLALFVVYVFVLMDYFKQHREARELDLKITETSDALSRLPTPPADLEGRLAAAKSELEQAQAFLSEKPSTTQIINDILRLSAETAVRAIPLITQPWKTERLADQTVSVLRLSITASGGWADLASFIRGLEAAGTQTLVITSLTLERSPQNGTEGNPGATARIEMAVYTRQPPAELPTR